MTEINALTHVHFLQQQNFVHLVRELRQEFDKYGYLLTAAVSAGEFTIRTAYDIPALARYELYT